MAATLDGKIGKDSDHFPDWTGKADKALFSRISKECGAIIFGRKTFETIGKPLPGRKNIILTSQPKLSEWNNLIFTNQTPQEILAGLESEDFTSVVLGGGAGINSLFAAENLINELWVSICPKIFGGGISLFDSHTEMNLKLLFAEKLDDQTMLLKYQVKKPKANG